MPLCPTPPLDRASHSPLDWETARSPRLLCTRERGRKETVLWKLLTSVISPMSLITLTHFIAQGTDIPKGDWETELLLVSSKAPAVPGCLPEERSVLHFGEQHGQRGRGCEQACLGGNEISCGDPFHPIPHYQESFLPPSPSPIFGMVLTPSGSKGHDRVLRPDRTGET